MSQELKAEYLAILRLRYAAADKKLKGQILDECCANTGLNRKYVIRTLRQPKPNGFRKNSGRKPIYKEVTVRHLKKLWILSGQMCSRNLKKALPTWLPHYLAEPWVKLQLLKMSRATIYRLLSPFRSEVARSKRSGTKPGKMYQNIIPIKPFEHPIRKPGWVEADTVAHCGGSLMGDFIWSLTFTDTWTGWTEMRGVWGKGSKNVKDAIADIEQTLPFEIEGFNCDNGTEFLNQDLISYFSPGGNGPERKRMLMTRSRAYRKNDNCHVEQKNWTHVRNLFGYERFEFQDLLPLMNDIYKNEHRWLVNFFIPQMKLKEKIRVGSKYKRKYDEPKTPYERLKESKCLTPEKEQELEKLFRLLNPFELMQARERKLKAFFEIRRQIQSNNEAAKARAIQALSQSYPIQ